MKGQETRQRILREALRAFSAHGYEGARVDRIAEAAGINKASLYFHFKGKRELFLDLLSSVVTRYETFVLSVANSCNGSNVKERLSAFCETFLDDSLSNPEIDFWNRIYYMPPADMKQDILNLTKKDKHILVEVVSQLLEQGKAEGDLKEIDCYKAATAIYYPLTCIALSKDIMSREDAMNDLNICLDRFFASLPM